MMEQRTGAWSLGWSRSRACAVVCMPGRRSIGRKLSGTALKEVIAF